MVAMDLRALWNLSGGLYVVSARSADGKLNGQIANAVIQVSATPPRVVVAINKDNLTHRYIEESGSFAVSVLGQNTPMMFIGKFGFKSGHKVDKFADTKFETGEATGSPVVLDHTLSFLEARVEGSMDAGTHTVFMGEVVGAGVVQPGEPLTYAYYHREMKGKEPKSAPSYRG